MLDEAFEKRRFGVSSRRGWLRRVEGEIVRRLREHDMMMMAAAISFYWLLGLIPLLLLGTSAVGYMLGSSDRAADEVLAVARRLLPRATGREVQEFIRGLIQSRHVTGILGIGFLLWVATGVFEIITSSLTALTEGKETRSYLRRKLVALVLMCTVGLLLILTVMGGWIMAAWPNIEDLLGIRLALPAFLTDRMFPHYLTSVLIGLALTIVYHVAPVRGIGWPSAVTGATVAAALWHQAKVFFNWYLTRYSRLNVFFGILGGFVILLLWFFYTAIILLLGGMLADILDRGGRPPKRGG